MWSSVAEYTLTATGIRPSITVPFQIDRGMAISYPVCAGATPPARERAIKQAISAR